MASRTTNRTRLIAAGVREASVKAVPLTASFAVGAVATYWVVRGTSAASTTPGLIELTAIAAGLTLFWIGYSAWRRARRTAPAGAVSFTTAERYRLLVENATVCIKELDAEGRIVSMNPAGLGMVHLERESDVRGVEMASLIDEGDREFVRRAHARALEGVMSELTFGIHVEGNQRWFDSSFVPIRDREGRVSRVMGITSDVTRQHLAEQRKGALTRELDHRVKNTLAMVIALADQSMSGSDSYATFREKFSGRIQALARNHQNLSATQWRGVGTAEILRATFSPFDAGRLYVEGETVILPARTSGPLTLALNELATNAAKYGAFSGDEGDVHVDIRRDDLGLDLAWREHVPQGISAPERLGVGLSLVRGLVEHELAGTVQFEFAPTGIECRIRFPLDDEPEPAAV